MTVVSNREGNGTPLSLPRAWVQSLVEEPRSCKHHSGAKKKPPPPET